MGERVNKLLAWRLCPDPQRPPSPVYAVSGPPGHRILAIGKKKIR